MFYLLLSLSPISVLSVTLNMDGHFTERLVLCTFSCLNGVGEEGFHHVKSVSLLSLR